jgi:hypothetical protein
MAVEFEDVTDMNFGFETYRAVTKLYCYFIVAFGSRYQLRIRLHTSPHWETYNPATLEKCKLWANEWNEWNETNKRQGRFSNTMHFSASVYGFLVNQSGEFDDRQAYFESRREYAGSHIDSGEYHEPY